MLVCYLVVAVPIAIVVSEQVHTKVVFQMSPDRMNMVGIILDIIVFDKEGLAMYPIVVGLPTVVAASPGKMDLIEVRLPQFFQFILSNLCRHPIDIFINQRHQHFFLRGGH